LENITQYHHGIIHKTLIDVVKDKFTITWRSNSAHYLLLL